MGAVHKFKLAVLLCSALPSGMAWAGAGLAAGEPALAVAGAGSFSDLAGTFSAAQSLRIEAARAPVPVSTSHASAHAVNPAVLASVSSDDAGRCATRGDCEHEHEHVSPVPEPMAASLALTGFAVLAAALAFLRRRR
jgi:hypothetical protein